MTIVFTNGCFDLLHSGHIRMLKAAKDLGDILIVGLNSDESIKKLKGFERPIMSINDRAEVLCAIESVDYVIRFDEDTPINLIQLIQPDIIVKGNDWKNKHVIGSDFISQYGGKVHIVNASTEISTTGIIKSILDRNIKRDELRPCFD